MNEQDGTATESPSELAASGALERPAEVATEASEVWPPNYFPATYGALHHDPLTRAPQGEFEIREPME